MAGNYDSYVRTRSELEENQMKQYQKEQEQVGALCWSTAGTHIYHHGQCCCSCEEEGMLRCGSAAALLASTAVSSCSAQHRMCIRSGRDGRAWELRQWLGQPCRTVQPLGLRWRPRARRSRR